MATRAVTSLRGQIRLKRGDGPVVKASYPLSRRCARIEVDGMEGPAGVGKAERHGLARLGVLERKLALVADELPWRASPERCDVNRHGR